MHIEHDAPVRFVAMLGLLGLGLLASAAVGQECPRQPDLSTSTVTVETKGAVSGVFKVIGDLGLDVNFTKTRDSVLSGHPRADQAIVVMSMAATLCTMIWTDTGLSGSQKADRYATMMFEVMLRARGPEPVAATDGAQQRSSIGLPSPLLMTVAYADTFYPEAELLTLAQAPEVPTLEELQEGQSGWLRDRPFYITDYNKYFVIVGSARTEEEGRRMLGQLKSRAPQYDFQLYAPYGSNTYYGVMMATWVTRDVAQEALEAARRTVAPDAYLWACRSKGNVC